MSISKTPDQALGCSRHDMLRIAHCNFFSKKVGVSDMTKRLQAASSNVALDALPQKCKCHKQHKSTNFWRGHLCPLCTFVARRTSSRVGNSRRGSARSNESQLNSRRELPYVRSHTYKKKVSH